MFAFDEDEFGKKLDASIEAWRSGCIFGLNHTPKKGVTGNTDFDKGVLAGQEILAEMKKKTK